jgi:hypothetical protein
MTASILCAALRAVLYVLQGKGRSLPNWQSNDSRITTWNRALHSVSLCFEVQCAVLFTNRASVFGNARPNAVMELRVEYSRKRVFSICCTALRGHNSVFQFCEVRVLYFGMVGDHFGDRSSRDCFRRGGYRAATLYGIEGWFSVSGKCVNTAAPFARRCVR